jgi:dTDP-4-amino-4,6-dideoxygalactose transaminase
MIPCSNPRAQYEAHREAIDAAVRRVFESGSYILGREVEAFEAEYAAYQEVGDCVAVGSGTEALHVALRALGIGRGDEVITVAHTAVATVSAIELAGAVPVFADIDPVHYTLDPSRLAGLVTRATRAVIAVHLYGQPADIDAIQAVTKRHGLRLIEDCAQAHGALYKGRKVGSLGDVGAFSCYPTKNLGALGDGGMLVTADPALARQARLCRQYGWAERNVSRIAGFNSRLDEVQAAILRVKLPFLDSDNRARAAIAARYDEGLAAAGLGLPAVRPACAHARHLYVVRSRSRDRLQAHLKERGIGTLVHYPVPVHLQPAYKGRFRGGDALPETERAAGEVLSLPIYPELSAPEVNAVIRAVRTFAQTPAG